MSNVTYRVGGMTAMLGAFFVAARVLVPVIRGQNSGGASWQLSAAGAALLASPLLGLLFFELLSGRALGFGFSVFSRTAMQREYWRCVVWHCAFLFTIVAATCAYFFSRR